MKTIVFGLFLCISISQALKVHNTTYIEDKQVKQSQLRTLYNLAMDYHANETLGTYQQNKVLKNQNFICGDSTLCYVTIFVVVLLLL